MMQRMFQMASNCCSGFKEQNKANIRYPFW